MSAPPHRLNGILGTLLRRWRAGRQQRQLTISFRSTDPPTLRAAYGAMSAQEFEDLNGAQCLLNRRLIPRALAAHPHPEQPWRIADLGCGNGGSGLILVAHAPPGSTLIGFDLCPVMIARAAARPWRDSAGAPLQARFSCQSITEPLREPDGAPLAAASLDVVHTAGVVGHHLTAADARALAGELRRVLAPDGIAIVDSGPRLRPRPLRRIVAAAGFELVARHRLWPLAKRAALVFRRAGGR